MANVHLMDALMLQYLLQSFDSALFNSFKLFRYLLAMYCLYISGTIPFVSSNKMVLSHSIQIADCQNANAGNCVRLKESFNLFLVLL